MADTVYEVASREPAPEALRIHAHMVSLVARLKPRSVLEVGCGTGLLGARIAELGSRYVGIEPDAAQLEIARRNVPGLEILPHSCYDPPERLELGTFDLVISNDVIEHLYLPRRLVAFKKAHLAPGGAAVTCTPHYGDYLRNLAISLLGRWDHHHSALWDGGHIKFFSPATLKEILAEQGFSRFEWSYVRSIRMPMFPMSMVCVARLE